MHLVIYLTDTHTDRQGSLRPLHRLPAFTTTTGLDREWNFPLLPRLGPGADGRSETEQNSGRRVRGKGGRRAGERERKRSTEWTEEETCFAMVQDEPFPPPPPPQQRTLQSL